MNKIVTQIADVITSLGMVIFVLLMTVIAMIIVGHGLYYQVFIKCMSPWQADVASWVLSFGVETTVLVITCNAKHFSSRHLPAFFAICSGFIALFFIKAFDVTQPSLDIAIRWFIGLLVAGVNFVYSELFVKKFQEFKVSTDLLIQVDLLKIKNEEINTQLKQTIEELDKANEDIKRLGDLTTELEAFKKKEIDRNTCSYCGKIFPNIYHLNSHRNNCDKNPIRDRKETVSRISLKSI